MVAAQHCQLPRERVGLVWVQEPRVHVVERLAIDPLVRKVDDQQAAPVAQSGRSSTSGFASGFAAAGSGPVGIVIAIGPWFGMIP